MGPPERFDSTSNLTYSRDNGNSKLLTALLVIVALVAIVAVVIAAVALTRQGGQPVVNVANPSGQSGGGQPIVIQGGGSSGGGGAMPPRPPSSPNGRPRTWSIAIGHDWGAHEYFDSKGYIQGFSKDLINAVCNAGNMDCYPVWMPYNDCWDNAPGEHGRGGEGLMDRWVDACTGWIPTTDRIHTLSFGLPYIKNVQSHFYRLQGSSVDQYDLKDKNVGFLQGWWSDEKCLARHESATNKNYVLKKEQIFLAPAALDLVNLLRDGTIDLAVSSLDNKEKYFEHIEELSDPPLNCAMGGSTLMTRKDSPFLTEWNRAFQKLKSSGQFARVCQEAQQRHELHGQLWCVD